MPQITCKSKPYHRNPTSPQYQQPLQNPPPPTLFSTPAKTHHPDLYSIKTIAKHHRYPLNHKPYPSTTTGPPQNYTHPKPQTIPIQTIHIQTIPIQTIPIHHWSIHRQACDVADKELLLISDV